MDYPGRIIKEGERDRRIVSAIQARLHDLGPLDRSGVFGPQTRASVKLFQARNVDTHGRSLKPDGRVGPLTWAALFGPEAVPGATDPIPAFLAAVLEKAGSQEGVREDPKDSNAGPEVNEYLRRVGVPLSLPVRSKPWCCAFVYWCFDEAARASARPNPMVRTAGVLDHWNNAARKGAERIAARRAHQEPALVRAGTIFVLDFGAGKGHTGLVEKVAGGILHTIEGNTDASGTREGGGVYRRSRTISEINKGFIDYVHA